MYTSDKSILWLVSYLTFKEKVKNDQHFASLTKLPKDTISKVKGGSLHFKVTQIQRICQVFDVNANWVIGMNDCVFNDENSIKNQDFLLAKAL